MPIWNRELGIQRYLLAMGFYASVVLNIVCVELFNQTYKTSMNAALVSELAVILHNKTKDYEIFKFTSIHAVIDFRRLGTGDS